MLVYGNSGLVAFDTYDGSDPDVTCSLRSLSINSNLSNQTVTVRIQARTYHTNVLIRARSVGLWQHYTY